MDFLLKRGQISSDLTFIHAGSLRLYAETDRGELTLNFFTENQWAGDLESLVKQQPSQYFIEAMEVSDTHSISLKAVHDLMNLDPCFRMLNSLMGNLTIPSTHLTALNIKSPDERYRQLLAEHPNWINRFPQMHIASYLGMTPETLSRVRARVI